MSEFPFGNVVCGGCNQMVAPVEKYNGRWYCLRCHYNLIKSELAALRKERDEYKEKSDKYYVQLSELEIEYELFERRAVALLKKSMSYAGHTCLQGIKYNPQTQKTVIVCLCGFATLKRDVQQFLDKLKEKK